MTGDKQFYFNSKFITIKNGEDIDIILDNIFQAIYNKIEDRISEDSGWVIKSINDDYIYIYDVLKSCYISLPEELKNSNEGITNIMNNDHECFRCHHV